MSVNQLCWFVVALWMMVPVVSAEKSLNPEVILNKASELFKSKDFEGAIPLFDKYLSLRQETESVLWNLGTAAILSGRFSKAIQALEQYRVLAPEDWEVLPRLIQAYHGSGGLTTRDELRKQLFTLRRTGSLKGLNRRQSFCREQLLINGTRVRAYEYFEPLKSEEAWFYEFYATDDAEKILYSISMGSNEVTNSASLASGNHKPHQRLYHFDGNLSDGTHWTIGFYVLDAPMSYDEARKIILEAATKGSGDNWSMSVPSR